MADVAAVRGAMRANTRIVWVETPSNPLWKITDIAAIGEIARAAGARYVCDNTKATPVLQSPLKLSADLVGHTTAKYLSGQSDVFRWPEGFLVARQVFQMDPEVPALACARVYPSC